MVQETKIWWDSITLQKYVDKNMIPRGLRIKKIPTKFYSELFKEEWNNVLSACSVQLMKLIIKEEEELLKQISEDIKNADLAVNQYKDVKDFDDQYQKLKDKIDNLEEWISTIKKKGKFTRDVRDYNLGQVYEWKGRDRTGDNPRSILKKKKKRYNSQQRRDQSRNVSFSSTSVESSDAIGETSCDSDGSSNPSTKSNSKSSKKTRNEAKNYTANEEAESIGGARSKIRTRQNP